LDFTGGIINVNYEGQRIAENTLERRKRLAEYFRVYINGELILGEMRHTMGNGHQDYNFGFEKYQGIDSVNTIRLELGVLK
jgi:hypothetical protein